jgi:hypothetical protein
MGKKGKKYIKPEQQTYDIKRIFEMVTGSSEALKPGRKELYAVLSTEKNRLGEFELGLHGVRENTKEESKRAKH